MIIDCHAHVYQNPLLKTYRKDDCTPFMSAQQQIELMDRKGIDMAVILPLNNPEAPGEKQSIGEVLSICQQYRGRFMFFCNIDPRLIKRTEMIEVADYEFYLEQYRQLGCKGLGELTARVYFDEPFMLNFFKACENIGFPVTFHMTMPHIDSYGVLDEVGLPHLENVLKYCPNLKLIGHSLSFWSEISGDVTIETKETYPKTAVVEGGRIKELMRKYPNLYADLSAGSGLNALQRDTEHAWKFIDEFQEKLLLGLDYCSVTNDMQHIEWLTGAKNNGDISEKVFEKIMCKNAIRILDLKI